MRNKITGLIVAPIFALCASSANAQSLGAAANYDIFALNGGTIELKDANQLFGQVAISNGAELDAGKESSTFDGTIFRHTGGTISGGSGLNPSGGIKSSASINSAINQANIDVANYVTYLNGLTATNSYNKQSSAFSFNSTKSLTVLDFKQIDLDGENFTLNGRVGGMDQFIIRVSEDFEFKEADLILNNLAVDNVIWYYSGDNNFDLHKSDDKNFMKFSGTVIAPNSKSEIRLGEVAFTGRVIGGGNMKLGSGFEFQGTAIPEPSSSIMLLIGVSSLMLVRRRKA
ncbi:PEP-CTERM sorting domain-containing protein [Akkermansiaceae bacterium]|nr:PEP-CTERM sorting domain-containing protein [Akkermansiaceae bacterium]